MIVGNGNAGSSASVSGVGCQHGGTAARLVVVDVGYEPLNRPNDNNAAVSATEPVAKRGRLHLAKVSGGSGATIHQWRYRDRRPPCDIRKKHAYMVGSERVARWDEGVVELVSYGYLG